jgi:imidazolonepropionase-like amidohydrolase
MTTTYLLKGGVVATWTKDGARTYKSDVLIQGSTITNIAEDIPVSPEVEVIDCKDKWIAPGFIDTHRYVMVLCHTS